ncbi:MAG: hypothetical protein AVDCRST_MAG32-2318, partial [uncultured Nocardioides sp.]
EPLPGPAPGPRGRVGGVAGVRAREGHALARPVPRGARRRGPHDRHGWTAGAVGAGDVHAPGRGRRRARHGRPVHRDGRAGRGLLPARVRGRGRPACRVPAVRGAGRAHRAPPDERV